MKEIIKTKVCQVHGEQPLGKENWYSRDMGTWTRHQCRLCIKQRRSIQYHRNPEKSKNSLRDFRRRNPEKIKFYWESYLLRHPGKADELNQKQRQRTEDRRLLVIKHYSKGKNCCASCGENHIGFLVVDHTYGGGTKHREKITGKGALFYKWLVKKGFPKGYQILCHNCNFVYGVKNQSNTSKPGKWIKEEKDLTYFGKYYRAHAEHLRAAAAKRNKNVNTKQSRKLKVMQHYSKSETPYCSCCGHIGLDFLNLDHIDGGGRKHRKEIDAGGSMIYLWITRNHFPNGFRILCWNCNFVMHKQQCPHQTDTVHSVLSV